MMPDIELTKKSIRTILTPLLDNRLDKSKKLVSMFKLKRDMEALMAKVPEEIRNGAVEGIYEEMQDLIKAIGKFNMNVNTYLGR